MQTSQALEAFLRSQINDTNRDLLERVIDMPVTDMEVQVMVAPGEEGEPVEGKNSTYTNGIDSWFAFRIPRGANTDESHWKDYPAKYDFQEHVSAVGLTGWNWKNRVSKWVTYDFDSIVGHASGVGISDHELNEVVDAVRELPYVEIRKSTGGRGYHLYVPVDDVPCPNHTIHQHLAGVILRQISEDVGVDLFSRVDVLGGNCWIWAARSSEELGSFALVKPATEKYQVEASWQDEVERVQQRRASRVSIGDDTTDPFVLLCSAHRKVVIDDSHKALRDWLAQEGCCVWDNERHCMNTHTKLLEKASEISELGIKGVFKTNSPGTNLNEPNCFCFPMDNGSWRVYRFGLGTNEHPSWTQDGRTWTSIYYNKEPDLKTAATVAGASQNKSGGYSFSQLKKAIGTIKSLSNDSGLEIQATASMLERPATVGKTKTGEVFVEIRKESSDQQIEGWNDTDKRNHWTHVSQVKDREQGIILDYDSHIRALRTPARDSAGYSLRHQDGTWTRCSPGDAKLGLIGLGNSDNEAKVIMGRAQLNSWTLTSIPFVKELPGGRRINEGAPQYRYKPKEYDGQDDPHPTWSAILNHCGSGLDDAIRNNTWCKENGVVTGGKYLHLWIATMMTEPHSRLPYLALYGQQNTGKSVLAESISLLVTRGVVAVDNYLAGSDNFCGHLEGAILGTVEETEIGGSQKVMNRLKALVTSPTLSIRRMRMDAYEVRNHMNFIQTTNDMSGLPKFDDDDTRITLIEVLPLTGEEIPKAQLFRMLKEEAPFFMYSLMETRIPSPVGRLRIPVVTTSLKRSIGRLNSDPLSLFIRDFCEFGTEYKVELKEFTEIFRKWDESGIGNNKNERSNTLGERLRRMSSIDVRKGTGNKTFVHGLRIKAHSLEEHGTKEEEIAKAKKIAEDMQRKKSE